MEKWIVGYVRISLEDKETTSMYSQSIENQMMIIQHYCEENHYCLHKFYIDDGVSGMHDERIGFQELLRDIEKGNIAILLLKDISRLGRNAVQTCYYIEEYFKIHAVRCISIDERIDTLNLSNEWILPIKSILNDFYVKEISNKRKQVALLKTQNHEFIGPYAPYGYQIVREKKRRTLEIDPTTSSIVKWIYSFYVGGVSKEKIATLFNQRKYPTPLEVIRKEEAKSCWNATIIQNILQNKVYKGSLILRKSVKKKERKRHCIAKREQIEIKHVFPAIVDEMTFSKCNQRKVYQPYCKNAKKQELYPVQCSRCNQRMHLYSRKKGDLREYFYKCLQCHTTFFVSHLHRLLLSLYKEYFTYIDQQQLFEKMRIHQNEQFISMHHQLMKRKHLMQDAYFGKCSGKVSLEQFLSIKDLYFSYANTVQEKEKKCQEWMHQIDFYYEQFRERAFVLDSFIQKIEIGNTVDVYFSFHL